jgi:hypothetical protein
MLTILDGKENTYYLIHVLPAMNAAVVAWFLWAKRRVRWRMIAIPIVVAWTLAQISLSVYRGSRNAYRNDYIAVVSFMRSHINGNTRVVFAPQEYGFQLGFGPLLVTDMRLGFNSGRVADMIVTGEAYEGDLRYLEQFGRPLADHIRDAIARYCVVYRTNSARVLLPRGEGQPACAK